MGRTNFSSYMAIKSQLLTIFRQEQFENNKLPAEAVLAKRLGISLVTLRESLMMLALEGYITKKHGSGNYVHPSALDSVNRLDLGISFADTFRQKGYQPGMQVLSVSQMPAGEELADRFQIGRDATLCVNEVIYTADNVPSIYTVQYMPEALLQKPFEISESNWNIHEVIWEYCGVQVAHSLNDYKSIIAPQKVAELLELEQGSPVLYCEQLFYDIQDIPIMYNVHFFNQERYGVRILQNWDLNT